MEAILKEAEVDDKGQLVKLMSIHGPAPFELNGAEDFPKGLFDYKALAKRLCEGPKRIPDMP